VFVFVLYGLRVCYKTLKSKKLNAFWEQNVFVWRIATAYGNMKSEHSYSILQKQSNVCENCLSLHIKP